MPYRIDYNEDVKPTLSRISNPLPRQSAPTIPSGPEYDDMTESSSTAPRPTRHADGRLIFEGRWENVFTPNITPEEMFAGGAFAGGFFWFAHSLLQLPIADDDSDTYSHVLKTPLPASEDIDQLPFALPPKETGELLSNSDPDGSLNRFRVRAGQSLQEWEKAGWIWAGDPRGWAQWYVRFWAGRRCQDDERQVRRCAFGSPLYCFIPCDP
jgi:hypothetical protein